MIKYRDCRAKKECELEHDNARKAPLAGAWQMCSEPWYGSVWALVLTHCGQILLTSPKWVEPLDPGACVTTPETLKWPNSTGPIGEGYGTLSSNEHCHLHSGAVQAAIRAAKGPSGISQAPHVQCSQPPHTGRWTGERPGPGPECHPSSLSSLVWMQLRLWRSVWKPVSPALYCPLALWVATDFR